MEPSREILRRIMIGVIVVATLVVGCFALLYGTLLSPFGPYGPFGPPEPREPDMIVQATVQDVYQQDIAGDWMAIEQEIGPGSNYEMENFTIEYMNSGEIRSLTWYVRERGWFGDCTYYQIIWTSGEYWIYVDRHGCGQEPQMPVDQFVNVMTNDLIRGITPQEPYDFVFLNLITPVQQTIERPEYQYVFVWDGSRLQKPLGSVQGYRVDQYMYKINQDSDAAEMTDELNRAIVIGGTYQ